MNKLKVGIISFAHGHAQAFAQTLLQMPEVELTGIADEERSRAAPILDRHGIAYYENFSDLLATDVDAVLICSENSRHAELTIAAATAGKHVLCEKPLGIGIDEMKRMIAACRNHGVQLATAFPCRYLTAVVRAKQAIDEGEIGDIVAIKGMNRGSYPGGWFVDPALSGGGALLDHTVHIMDLMNWFTGSRVTEVYAYAATRFREEPAIDDTGMVHVKFANGVFGVIDTSWSRPPSFPAWGDVTMDIVGTKGTIAIDALAQKNELFTEATGKGTWSFWGDNMSDRMIRDWVNAMLHGQPAPITGEDGLRSTAVALTAYESVRQGRSIALQS